MLCVAIALVCFVLCLLSAMGFYHDALDLGSGGLDQAEQKREENLRKDARRCGDWCVFGVITLAAAGLSALALTLSLWLAYGAIVGVGFIGWLVFRQRKR
jgi:hypothetical protein